jgi:hypothetical protein
MGAGFQGSARWRSREAVEAKLRTTRRTAPRPRAGRTADALRGRSGAPAADAEPKTTSPRHFDIYHAACLKVASAAVVFSKKSTRAVKQGAFRASSDYWRNGAIRNARQRRAHRLIRARGPVDPATGRSEPPIVAAALCIEPRELSTGNQAARVDAMTKGLAIGRADRCGLRPDARHARAADVTCCLPHAVMASRQIPEVSPAAPRNGPRCRR